MDNQTEHIEATPVDIFISYARADGEYMEQLKKHLRSLERQKLINSWTDTLIQSGQKWSNEILESLEKAAIILFLMSPDFIDSDYIHEVEIKKAMERHECDEVIIVPIFIRFCNLEGHPLSVFQGLPDPKKPISKWEDNDEAWNNIIKGLKIHVKNFQKKKVN